MKRLTRRSFAQQAGAAMAVAPLAVKWGGATGVRSAPESQLERVQESRMEELKRKAEAQREQLVGRLRGKALPYDLEPAFVFAAKPKPRPKKKN